MIGWIERALYRAPICCSICSGTAGAKSGVAVTWETALQAASAIACARASLRRASHKVPLKLYRRRPDGRSDAATDHPMYSVLHSSPAPGIFVRVARDDGFAFGHLAEPGLLPDQSIRTVSRASRIELQPLTPQQVIATRNPDWSITYDVHFDSRNYGGYSADQILHFKGPRLDVDRRPGRHSLGAKAIGLALATEEHGARQFSNGAILGGILSTDSILSAEQSKATARVLEASQIGLKNAYRTAVLWGDEMDAKGAAERSSAVDWVRDSR